MYPEDWVGTDFYRSMGVSRRASSAEIKAEYRWLAKKFHPDLNPSDKRAEAKFREIQAAYDVLSRPDLREKYDNFLAFIDGHDESKEHRDGSKEKSPPPGKKVDQPETGRKIGLAVTLSAMGLLLAWIVLSSASFGQGFSEATSEPAVTQEQQSQQRADQALVAPTPSRYSPEDIASCRSYEEWRVDFGGAGTPTTNQELRLALNRMELDISSSFYLADDYELIQLSNAAKRAAGFSAAMVGTTDEAIWAMATTGFEDALGRLSAVCGTVR